MQNNLRGSEALIKDRIEDTQKIINEIINARVEKSRLKKSTTVLMLYNIIEGVLSSVLRELFDYIHDNKIEFDNLPEKLKHLILKYRIQKIGSDLKEMMAFYVDKDLTKVSYSEISNHLKLYSGNLDARKIREVSKLMGVYIGEIEGQENLLKIKCIRNRLAHGEVGFGEACRDISDKEISEWVSIVYSYMKSIIESYNKFIVDNIAKNA